MNRARLRYNASIAIAGVVAFLGAVPLATAGFERTGPQPFYAYLLLLVLLVPLGVAVWGWRAGTDADADGLRVRPGFRTHRIAWSQVSALVPRQRKVVVELTDGRTVALPAVTRADLPRLVAASGQQLGTDAAGADPGDPAATDDGTEAGDAPEGTPSAASAADGGPARGRHAAPEPPVAQRVDEPAEQQPAQQ